MAASLYKKDKGHRVSKGAYSLYKKDKGHRVRKGSRQPVQKRTKVTEYISVATGNKPVNRWQKSQGTLFIIL